MIYTQKKRKPIRNSKEEIEAFLSRPLGLVVEWKSPVEFSSDVLREIKTDKEAFSRKHQRVIFSGGKAFITEPTGGKRIR